MAASSDAKIATDPIDLWKQRIRERPLTALAVAASAGFLLGGGLRSRTGFGAAAFLVRTLAKEAALSVIQDTIAGDGHRHRPPASEPQTPNNGEPAFEQH